MKMLKVKLWALFIGAVLLVWLAKPTRTGIIAGLGLIAVGEFLRIWGCGHLQKNKELVVTGPYAYVKNPLYLGTVLITVGLCVLANNIYLLAAIALMFSLYYIPYKKTVEANRLRAIFGAPWEDYDAKVPDLFPRLTPYSDRKAPWRFRLFLHNSELGIVLLLVAGVALILTREHWSRWLGGM